MASIARATGSEPDDWSAEPVDERSSRFRK